MSFTYDTSTNVGKVRLLISDKTEATAHFSNEELAVFLSMVSDSVKIAAALALEVWAAALSDTADSEKIGDYAYTKKQAANKLELAKRYREDEAGEPCGDWAEMDLTNYGDGED